MEPPQSQRSELDLYATLAYNSGMVDTSAVHEFWAGPSMIDLSHGWRRTSEADRPGFVASIVEQADAEGEEFTPDQVAAALDELHTEFGFGE
jgi:hypothetical protein